MPTKFKPTDVQRIRLQNQLDFFIANGYSPGYSAYHLAILCRSLDVAVEYDKIPETEEDVDKEMDTLFQFLGYERVGDWDAGRLQKIVQAAPEPDIDPFSKYDVDDF